MASEKNYFRNTQPFRVPTTDGKLIEEHIGLASTHTAQYSVAHMVAPRTGVSRTSAPNLMR